MARFWIYRAAVFALVMATAGSIQAQAPWPHRIVKTPTGSTFALIGNSDIRHAPVIFFFGGRIDDVVQDPQVAQIEAAFGREPALFVTLDLPSHGIHQPPKEPNPLHDWRVRIERGDNFVIPFLKSVSEILDYLVAEGYADSHRVAVAGISRGGYLALQFAAAEPRVRCIAAFAPVTDLLALREFDGMDKNALAQSLSALNLAQHLASRKILILIGSTDYRVGTRNAILLHQQITQSALAQDLPPKAELRVGTTRGHHLELYEYSAGGTWLAASLDH